MTSFFKNLESDSILGLASVIEAMVNLGLSSTIAARPRIQPQ
jgi:hypothetical protein